MLFLDSTGLHPCCFDVSQVALKGPLLYTSGCIFHLSLNLCQCSCLAFWIKLEPVYPCPENEEDTRRT